MSTELFLNFLGIRMDSRKAEGLRFTINLVTPDNGEKFIIEMENATLTNIAGFQAEKPDLTLTINRSDLEQTMMGAKTLEAQIADGTAKVEGDVTRPRQARRDDGRLRPALRDHARHQARTAAIAHAGPPRPCPARPSPNNQAARRPHGPGFRAFGRRRPPCRRLVFLPLDVPRALRGA